MGPGQSDRVRAGDLGTTRLLWWFAGLSLLLLAALASAPIRSHFTAWRRVQDRYNARAAEVGSPAVAVAIKQLWKPELGRVDRCGSCHLGMGEATPDPHERLFAAHPAMPHEPRDLGCTICHGGQGRATSEAAAHGAVAFWDEPMLAPGDYEAGCGTCHVPAVPAAAAIARGQAVFEQNACFDCHRIAGKGRGDGPDLSLVGLKGFAAGWHAGHVARAAAGTGVWKTSFAPIAEADQLAVDGFLRSQIGAPRLFAGKALSLAYGCRGCHKIEGVGGEEGPELTAEGRKVARELDYGGVRGEHTLAGWLRAHFLDPARVVPGSQMPDLGMTSAEAELLTVYMLSLRAEALPEALIPRDRLRAVRLGERDFASDGASLYGAFCVGCHGTDGRGKRFGLSEYTFPAIGSAAFLAVVDDDLLRATITSGRPGRKMPAWGTKDGGLHADEVDRVAAYLRSLEPAPPDLAAVLAVAPDPTAGRATYLADCQGCHGRRGEGSAIGSPLAAADDAIVHDDARLYQALIGRLPTMGSFRAYDAATLRQVMAYVSQLAPIATSRAAWTRRAGDGERGAALFADTCAGCHGAHGEGKDGPALANPAFLAAASDDYLASTIVRGRGDTAMPHFGRPGTGYHALAGDEVADVVAFVRSLAAKAKPAAPRSEP